MTEATPLDPGPLRLERTFAAPAHAVFDAWTSAAVLRQWWPAGPGWEMPVAEVDARVGGALRLVMRHPEGKEFGGSGEYIEVDPPRRLVFTWTWDSRDPGERRQLVEVGVRRPGRRDDDRHPDDQRAPGRGIQARAPRRLAGFV